MSNLEFTGDSMLEMYLFESATLLEQLDEILLMSEKSMKLPQEDINEIFRIMHTIKGSSAMMEYNAISYTAHKLEDLFFIIRENGIRDTLFGELFDLVLKVSDFLKEEVEKIKNNEKLSVEDTALIHEILDFIGVLSKKIDIAEPSSKENKIEPMLGSKTEVAVGSNDSGVIFNMHITFTPDCQMENIRAFMLLNMLAPLGEILATLPVELNSNPDASAIISENGFYCRISSNVSMDEILETVKGTLSVLTCIFIDNFPALAELAIEDKSIEPLVVASQAAGDDITTVVETSSKGSNDINDILQKSKAGKQNLISVDLNKLDTLMDLVGEIVITESMVSGSPDLLGLELESFHKSSRQLRKLTDELQGIVMSIRMIPIAATFQKMQRIVRDMNKKLSKDVDLILSGEDTEVDKTIIDGIADPLMHLVRNAMDHGIESREQRIAAGKNPIGQLILSAQNSGGDIIISVSDNGRGLDPDIILAKAREHDILTKPPGEMTEKEIFNLLTLPGFSTKEAVTEFSGRGVGMDVVKKNIEKIGGSISIESKRGYGTTIFFRIPLTLAIIDGMEIRVNDNIYTLPIPNIRESFKALEHQLICDPDGNEMIMIRGACYPIIRLHKIYGIAGSLEKIEDGILLLVDSGDRLACIFVDGLVGKHQVVVKPVPSLLNRYPVKKSGIAGCTILGDGSISLILDVQSILNRY
ncbi:MAG: chemotaxis protein CheA [Eubacteriales bacterium]